MRRACNTFKKMGLLGPFSKNVLHCPFLESDSKIQVFENLYAPAINLILIVCVIFYTIMLKLMLHDFHVDYYSN